MRRCSAAAFAAALLATCLASGAERDFVRLERVEFRGQTVVPDAELAALAQPMVGRDVSVAEIEDLRQRVTRLYVDRGYVNSGAIVEPAGIPGVVVLRIVEGRLEAIRIRGLERLREDYVVSRLAPDPHAPFNMNALQERFQLLLADPLFERMHASVVPGSGEGSAFLDLEVVRARPYEAAIFANNYRPPSIGEYAAGASGRVRNLTTLGDALDLSLQVPLQGSDQRPKGDASWRVPVGPWGTELSALWSRGRSAVIEEPSRALDIRSYVTTLEGGIAQVLFENLRHRFAVGFAAADRESVTTLGGEPFSFVLGEPEGVTRVKSRRFWQEYAHRRDGATLVLRSTFARNRNNLEEVTGLPIPVEIPDSVNRTWIGQIYGNAQLGDSGAQASLRATVQRTHERLPPLDSLAVGGVNSVRGFRENQLLRDAGEYLGIDADMPVYADAERNASARVGAFADYGTAWNQAQAHASLASAGMSLKARWARLRFDLFVALYRHRSADVPKTTGALQDHGIHMQFAYAIF
jgi:hemolysin activation/secretion protein